MIDSRSGWLAAGCLAVAISSGLAFPHAASAAALSQAQFQALNDKLSNEVSYYLGAEEEKHADGKPYIDLGQRFEYMPSRGRGGTMVIHAKIGGAEYVPNNGEISKGIATGKIKYLLFTYALRHGEWTEIAKPQWQTQSLGRKAAQRMTEAAVRDEAAEAAARERALRATPQAAAHPTATATPVSAPTSAATPYQ
ncbi:MAG: hypothetical protein ACREPW_02590 [Candidatus Binataceae bacterium]